MAGRGSDLVGNRSGKRHLRIRGIHFQKYGKTHLLVFLKDGTVDFSSELAMPLDSTAECAEPRRGLKTVSKLRVLRGDKSLDFQTVS